MKLNDILNLKSGDIVSLWDNTQTDDALMFIKTNSVDTKETNDEYTKMAEELWEKREDLLPAGRRWRGSHGCSCGKRSDHINWFVKGSLTNSLLVHYVKYHREEVPQYELDKLKRIYAGN